MLIDHIDHLAAQPGIEAIYITTCDGERRVHRSAKASGADIDLAEATCDLLVLARETDARVIIGGRTILVQCIGDEIAAVVTPTGHAIAKSLRRMLRKAARPSYKPKTAPTTVAA